MTVLFELNYTSRGSYYHNWFDA